MLHDLSRIHDVVGIERGLDPAHHVELDRGLVAADFVALQAA